MSSATLKTLPFFVRCDSRRSTPGGEIPQNLPRRHLSRLALAGFSRFCGNLALRTFQCSPLCGSAFQCYAYCSFCLQFTPQRSLSATYRVQLRNAGDFAEPIPPPLRASLRARRSLLRRASQRAARPLIPGRCFPHNFAEEIFAYGRFAQRICLRNRIRRYVGGGNDIPP